MKIPLFDAHCDTAFKMVLKGYGLADNNGHTDLRRGTEYAPYAQFYALFAMDERDVPAYFPAIQGMSKETMFAAELVTLLRELDVNSDRVTLCRTAKDARRAAAENKTAAFLSIEGAELIGCDLKRLDEMFALGVRALNLTWNNPNALVCESGLTELGREFVRRCEKLGIIVDVSHLPDDAFWDVAEMAEKPFMASHSNSRVIFPHKRNLTDAQFAAIMSSGGVAGINLYSGFIAEKPDIPAVIRHIEHFLSLGGGKTVALGCDLDGCDSLPDGISGIENVKEIYNALLRLNYDETLLRDIFYNNLMRVVEKVCVI